MPNSQAVVQYGKVIGDFTPKPMIKRDENAPVIDMNFNLMNQVIRFSSDRLASLSTSITNINSVIGSLTIPVSANPGASVGLVAVNGSALTFMRSDAAPALSQAIVPTWSALHTFTLAPKVSAFAGGGAQMVVTDNVGQLGVQAIPGIAFANPTGTIGLSAVNGSASTATRSDSTHALSQAIVPTWSGAHTFSTGIYPSYIANESITYLAVNKYHALVPFVSGAPWTSNNVTFSSGSILQTNSGSVFHKAYLTYPSFNAAGQGFYVKYKFKYTIAQSMVSCGVSNSLISTTNNGSILANGADNLVVGQPGGGFATFLPSFPLVSGTVYGAEVTYLMTSSTAVSVTLKIYDSAFSSVLASGSVNTTGSYGGVCYIGLFCPADDTQGELLDIITFGMDADSGGGLLSGDPNFVYDERNHCVGIGKSSPVYGLDLNNSLRVTGTINFPNQLASKALFTDASSNLTSNSITGTGNVVMSASPTLTGTITAASANFSGTATFGIYTGQTNIVTVGTITTGTWSASTIAVNKGGTGATTLAVNGVLYGNSTSAIQALVVNSSATNKFLTQSSSGSPAWSTIAASDLPGSFSGLANPSASIGLSAVNGTGTTAIRSDGAPALSQAIVPTWSGVHTFTLQPIFSSLTASQAVFTDSLKGLVSNSITGTGNVVMSASPTLTGTIDAASANFSGSVTMGTNSSAGIGTSFVDFFLDGAAGQTRRFSFKSGGVKRWAFLVNSTAESGSDAGSPFLFQAYTDGGVVIDSVFSITRAAGGIISINRSMSGNDTTESTSISTGSINTQGGIGIAKACWVGGLANIAGVLTLQSKPIFSSLTASQAVFTDSLKGLVSNSITGTGNVVMSASPTLTGTIDAATLKLSSLIGTGVRLVTSSAASGTLANGTFISGVNEFSNTQAFDAGINFSDTAGTSATSSIWREAVNGLGFRGVAGSANDFVFQESGGNIIARNPIGTNDFVVGGNLKLEIVGSGFYIKEGANAAMGVATLVLGTATISTTKVTASSRIFLSVESLGTITTPVAVSVTARSVGTSFTITSSNLTDTSTVAWVILEPA